jgi:hypothetical protein
MQENVSLEPPEFPVPFLVIGLDAEQVPSSWKCYIPGMTMKLYQ